MSEAKAPKEAQEVIERWEEGGIQAGPEHFDIGSGDVPMPDGDNAGRTLSKARLARTKVKKQHAKKQGIDGTA